MVNMRLIAALALLMAPASDPIDAAIAAKAGGPLAGRSSDAEFLRRVTLDLAGRIPSAAETRAFLASPDRVKLIDGLLASPDHARRMQEAFTVMWLERRGGETIADREWAEWLRGAFAANLPWDRLVRELLAADGRDPASRPAVKFYLDAGRSDLHRLTTDVGRLFLGRNYLCAQCHDHPSIRDYMQADYMGLYVYVGQGKAVTNPKTKQPLFVDLPAAGKTEFASVFKPGEKKATGPHLPGGKEREVPTFPKGQEFAEPARDGMPGVPKFRPRALLSEDLVSGENLQFARNSVNRFWFLLMGRGLVHPLDLDHRANPPSHPELLDTLAAEFAAGGFDVRRLLRSIVMSETYHRSGLLPAGVAAREVRPESYRAAIARPLSAEQLARAALEATGNLEALLRAPSPEKGRFVVKDYLSGKSAEPPATLPDALKLFEAIFGNPAGEPEVDFQPSMSHALFLMNDRLILHWLEPRPGNLVDRLLGLEDPGAVADELYLSVLTRPPGAAEKAEVTAHLEKHRDQRGVALANLAWALLASAEFRLNH